MRAYERLIRYAMVHTTSDPESETCPSTARQFDLANMLVEELKALGLTDAFVDEYCYVYATIPATDGCEEKPALGLIAHMDTAPDASGENVKPVLHENYDGKDVPLPNGTVLSVNKFPFLRSMKGPKPFFHNETDRSLSRSANHLSHHAGRTRSHSAVFPARGQLFRQPLRLSRERRKAPLILSRIGYPMRTLYFSRKAGSAARPLSDTGWIHLREYRWCCMMKYRIGSSQYTNRNTT